MLAFTPANSALVKFVQYDEFCKLLTVEIGKNGPGLVGNKMYQFAGVTRYRYDALKKAKSKGSYFSTSIKGKYPTRLVTMVVTGAGPNDVPLVPVTFKK